MSLTRAVALTMALLALGVPSRAAAEPGSRVETLLAALPFDEGERTRILAGELVTAASRETTSDRELAVTMAFLVNDPPSDLSARFLKAADYANEKTVTAFGELHGDGSVADLASLHLTPDGEEETRRFARFAPGTDLNLSSKEIAAFAALPQKTTRDVETELRTVLLERYRAYRSKGLAGIAPYDRGATKQSSPGEELALAATASPLVVKEAPEVAAMLRDYPRSRPAKATEKFFWVNFEIDGRPTITLTHRIVAPRADGAAVLVDRHYYVSRSHNDVQIVAGLFPVTQGALVVFTNRTVTDQLGGFGAGAKQAVGRRIMGGQLAALYEEIRARFNR